MDVCFDFDIPAFRRNVTAMAEIQLKHRNHLQLENDLRVFVSKIQLRMSRLVRNMQFHYSN
jgi:Flp pilus assembly CpaF family ATPase